MPTDASSPQTEHHDSNVIETIQSLIVAFVLAMTFRGFVTEGFVIPTGSMAPTLLGQHLLVHSRQTGATFPVGLDQAPPPGNLAERLTDPMLGPSYPGSVPGPIDAGRRMGDRILVLKCLYPFAEPKRFDVVVFKNPTDPVGDAANYIKRLIGLPNEHIWLVDGDVFVKKAGTDDFRIQRKPEHVQRAVWQTVHDSDFIPTSPERLDQRYDGPPWVDAQSKWDLSSRTYVCSSADPTVLTWDSAQRPLNDWSPYNMLAYDLRGGRWGLYTVSDLRVSAGIEAKPGLATTLEIEARSHLFQFILRSSASAPEATVTLRMRPLDGEGGGGDSGWNERTATLEIPDLAAGKVMNIEFWHADQSMQMFIDGEPVIEPLSYEWSAGERSKYSQAAGSGGRSRRSTAPLELRWRFEGAPVALYRVRVDRDLYYRPDRLSPGPPQQKNRPYISGEAFGTSLEENPGILGPDQFMMCGDNSQMSLDSRLWASPHPLVEKQIDPHPFTVHRRLLLGKAWVVYFPAPYSITEGGVPVVPDFGRLRFIR